MNEPQNFDNSDKVKDENVSAYENDGYASVFDNPASHNDRHPQRKKKNRILIIVASALVAAAFAGGTVAIIKLVPKKDEGIISSQTIFESIAVVDNSADDLDTVTVTNKNGTFRLVANRTEAEVSGGSSRNITVKWRVDGVDESKTDESVISSVADAAASLTATRRITSKTPDECGITQPVCKIDVESVAAGNYTISIGGESPDGSGVYVGISDDTTVYLVDESEISGFDFELLDLADTSTVAGIEITEDLSEYTDDNGSLVSFDSLTVSGKNFPTPVSFRKANDEEAKAYYSYMVSSPTVRAAVHIDELLKPFNEGLSTSGAYAMDVSKESLEKFGLNDPYLTVSISVGQQKRTFKISKIDEEYCAVIADDSVIIKKVPISDFPFIDYKTEDFYSGTAFLHNIDSLSEFKVETGGKTYVFSVVYDSSENAIEKLTVHIGGKKITADYFQSMYQTFLGISYVDYITDTGAKAPETKVTLSYSDGVNKDILTYSKSSETAYDFTLNGVSQGRIPASALIKFQKAAENAANDKKP